MSTRKNALDHGLGKFASDENRHDLMTLCHAVLSTAMVESALEKGDDVKRAASAECFARAIRLLEDRLGNTYSAVPNLPRTHFVQKSELPKK